MAVPYGYALAWIFDASKAYELGANSWSESLRDASQCVESDRFWDMQPCGGFQEFSTRADVRYLRDPWLLELLNSIASYPDVVEVGCGQGTDAITICRSMTKGSRYLAVDHSATSLASARDALDEMSAHLETIPEFMRADALRLPVDNDSVSCIYSCGVIHHIDDTEGALAEIHRVLRPSGRAFIAMYRTASPKVLCAHGLRAGQAALDRIVRKRHTILTALEFLGWHMPDGTTMVRECFGVPILKSYSLTGLRRLFREFTIREISPHGYLWLIEAEKPS